MAGTLLALLGCLIAICIAIKLMRNKNTGKRKDQIKPAHAQSQKTKLEYIINPETMVFHRPGCPHAEKTFCFNKHSSSNRNAIISVGYRPCKRCKP